MEIAFGTEQGVAGRRSGDAHLTETIAPSVTLLAIADGFGVVGRNVPTGQVALGHVRDFLRRRHRLGAYGRGASATVLRATLLAALDHANGKLFADGGSHDDFVGSGASVTAVLVVGEQAFVGHVGDARAYLARDAGIEMLTVDDAMFAGRAVTSPTSNLFERSRPHALLWRSLGTQAKLEASVAHVAIRSGDQLVLCTDGLHRVVDDEELGDVLAESERSDEAVGRFLGIARARGAVDATTVVVCRGLLASTPATFAAASYARLRFVVAMLLLVLALLSFGSYALHGGSFGPFSNFFNSDGR